MVAGRESTARTLQTGGHETFCSSSFGQQGRRATDRQPTTRYLRMAGAHVNGGRHCPWRAAAPLAVDTPSLPIPRWMVCPESAQVPSIGTTWVVSSASPIAAPRTAGTRAAMAPGKEERREQWMTQPCVASQGRKALFLYVAAERHNEIPIEAASMGLAPLLPWRARRSRKGSAPDRRPVPTSRPPVGEPTGRDSETLDDAVETPSRFWASGVGEGVWSMSYGSEEFGGWRRGGGGGGME